MAPQRTLKLSLWGGYDTFATARDAASTLARDAVARRPLLHGYFADRAVAEPAAIVDEITHATMVGGGRPAGGQGVDARAAASARFRAGDVGSFGLGFEGSFSSLAGVPARWTVDIGVDDRPDYRLATYSAQLTPGSAASFERATQVEHVMREAMETAALFGDLVECRRGYVAGPHHDGRDPLEVLNASDHHDVNARWLDGVVGYSWIVVVPGPLADRLNLRDPPPVVAEVRPLTGASAGGVVLRAVTAPAWMEPDELRTWRDVVAPVLAPHRNHMTRELIHARGAPPGVLPEDWVDLGPHDKPWTGPRDPNPRWKLA